MVLYLREDEIDIETDGIYSEGFDSCVFDGGSNMPELVIDDEPTVPSTSLNINSSQYKLLSHG